LYPAHHSHCEAGTRAFAARPSGKRRGAAPADSGKPGLLRLALCISLFIRGKYDFTSQFI
jgi:hypothetical protein